MRVHPTSPFPRTLPYNEGYLRVSDLHTIHYMECGNPSGKPVIFNHGGPAAGCSAGDMEYFDPKIYRVVLYDQRGCGKSTPPGEITENTTQHLVEDIETLRRHLGIESWMVFGGSWGSTLSLAYAQAHPEPVSTMIVRGIWFGGDWDTRQWTSARGSGAVQPEIWDAFISLLPPEDRNDYLTGYRKLFKHPDQAIRREAFKAWRYWDEATNTCAPYTEQQKTTLRKKLQDDVANE